MDGNELPQAAAVRHPHPGHVQSYMPSAQPQLTVQDRGQQVNGGQVHLTLGPHHHVGGIDPGRDHLKTTRLDAPSDVLGVLDVGGPGRRSARACRR